MEIKKRATRTNKKHQSIMLDFVEAHPEMVNTSFTQPQARQKYLELWKELTCMLNAMGIGNKTPTQWQRVLSDWITKTKSKLSNLNIDLKSTGGGPSSGNDLSEMEIRLMNLKGWACVVGDNFTTEAGFGQLSTKVIGKPTEDTINTTTTILLAEAPKTTDSTLNNETTYIPMEVQEKSYTPTFQKKNRCDMQEMHKETVLLLKETNENLTNMNNTMRIISHSLDEQVLVLKKISESLYKL